MSEIFTAFGIDYRLLGIQLFNFGLLLAVLWYFLYRPVISLLDERNRKIKEGVEHAEAAEKERKILGDERKAVIAKANEEAEAVVARAVSTGKDERSVILKGAQGQAETLLRDAESQALEIKRKALAESDKEIVRAAVLAAEKILQKS